jgi:aspartate carbamoyltransferase catalytic subunit
LLDTYTIWRAKKRLTGLKIVIGGDLLYGRAARSLAKVLACFEENEVVFVSIPELQMADDVKDYLTKKGVNFSETDNMQEAFEGADVVYWTRLQKERLPKGVEVTQSFTIDTVAMQWLPKDAIVMHPLPRVDEITTEVDDDSRAHYFEQAGNGMFIRMALLDQLLSKS